jgi:hypothetical protein
MKATFSNPPSLAHALRCVRCGALSARPGPLFRCGECAELLEVFYPEWSGAPREFSLRLKQVWQARRGSPLVENASGVWRFRELLPQVESRNIVTMG